MSERRAARAFAFVALLAFIGGGGSGLRAQTSLVASPPAVADCRAVSADDAARVLGYPVDAPDEASARGGICFYTARAVSQEGSLAYALVTPAELARRRAFFAASARRCGGVAASAPNAALCRSYARLAGVADLDAYFAARTDDVDATVVPALGERAIATPGALFVRRGEIVFECIVRRGETLDLARSTDLARLLLERTP